MDDLAERLRAFAAGCRGSMWQSRDKTVSLCDEAADEITALRARLDAVEKERDRLAESAEFWERCAVLNEKRFERAEAALATARRDALLLAADMAQNGDEEPDLPDWLANRIKGIRALANEAETKPVDGSFSD